MPRRPLKWRLTAKKSETKMRHLLFKSRYFPINESKMRHLPPLTLFYIDLL